MNSRGSDSHEISARPVSTPSCAPPPVLQVRIKNTFIDDFVYSDADDCTVAVRPGAQRSRSLPADRKTFTEENNLACFMLPTPIRVERLNDGSASHHLGTCRPCIWSWKEGGCKNGQACRHCHLCTFDEAQSRRKKKRATRTPLQLVTSAGV